MTMSITDNQYNDAQDITAIILTLGKMIDNYDIHHNESRDNTLSITIGSIMVH
jgi:hypothetical protein